VIKVSQVLIFFPLRSVFVFHDGVPRVINITRGKQSKTFPFLFLYSNSDFRHVIMIIVFTKVLQFWNFAQNISKKLKFNNMFNLFASVRRTNIFQLHVSQYNP